MQMQIVLLRSYQNFFKKSMHRERERERGHGVRCADCVTRAARLRFAAPARSFSILQGRFFPVAICKAVSVRCEKVSGCILGTEKMLSCGSYPNKCERGFDKGWLVRSSSSSSSSSPSSPSSPSYTYHTVPEIQLCSTGWGQIICLTFAS